MPHAQTNAAATAIATAASSQRAETVGGAETERDGVTDLCLRAGDAAPCGFAGRFLLESGLLIFTLARDRGTLIC